MSNFDETVIRRLTALEREVERLRVKERPAGGSGVTDHGALTGLSDNDHPQYLLTTGKAADSDKLDGIDSTGFATAGHDHDSDYLGISAKAADSDKLDGLDSTDFVDKTTAQTIAGIKTFSSIPVLPSTDPTNANQAVRKGYADATYVPLSYKDGWIPVSGTWTYASATTITVPSGAKAIYKVGQGVKLKHNGAQKWLYITAVADTQLTITGGSDYPLTSSGSNKLSEISYTNTPGTAIGFPVWFNVTAPTFAVATYDDGAGGQPTTVRCRFSIDGRTYKVHYQGSGTKAGTNTYFTVESNAFITPENYTTRDLLGTCYAFTTAMIPGVVSNQFVIYFASSITDNTTITNFAFNLSYEI